MKEYNFTERLRRILTYAHEEATRLAAPYTDADHLLLALLREGEGVGAYVLERLAGNLRVISDAIEGAIPGSGDGSTASSAPTFTARAKRVIAESMAIAREHRHDYVGSEHLLLGVLREGQSVSALLLSERGVAYDGARQELLRVLGGPETRSEERTTTPYAMSADIDVQMSDGTTRRERVTSMVQAMRFLRLTRLP